MKRKTFYSMYKENGITRAVEQEGVEIEIAGMKFNAYKPREGVIYIIDPKTGQAVFRYRYMPGMGTAEDDELDIADAKGELEGKREILKSLKKKRKTDRYRTMCLMFNMYRRGAMLEKKLDEDIMKDK